jgi:hypothetical protein
VTGDCVNEEVTGFQPSQSSNSRYSFSALITRRLEPPSFAWGIVKCIVVSVKGLTRDQPNGPNLTDPREVPPLVTGELVPPSMNLIDKQ